MAELDIQGVQTAKDVISEAEEGVTEYMRVIMNSDVFLIPVEAVLSVLRPVPLTPVPMAPDHLMGVANIRGQVFCVIDPGKVLRLKHKRKEQTSTSRFLLLRHARVHLGIWVEDVLDLHRVKKPEYSDTVGHSFEVGKVETPAGTFPILRVEALFD